MESRRKQAGEIAPEKRGLDILASRVVQGALLPLMTGNIKHADRCLRRTQVNPTNRMVSDPW